MSKERLDEVVLKRLNLPYNNEPDLDNWKDFLYRLKYPKAEVSIGLVGKYVELKDSYKSIAEAFIHAGAANECKVNIRWIHSDRLESVNVEEDMKGLDGVLVAPGFGERGFEGKLEMVRYARENKVPFLGICLGMQAAVIEFARNVLKLEGANSTEINPETKHPVIALMNDQKSIVNKGGTMRLGACDCELKEGSKAYDVYHRKVISERHRHRYEFNNRYFQQFEENGMQMTGINPDSGLVEIVELLDHPWFVGVQFHPEYKSTVARPHPLFVHFIAAVLASAHNPN